MNSADLAMLLVALPLAGAALGLASKALAAGGDRDVRGSGGAGALGGSAGAASPGRPSASGVAVPVARRAAAASALELLGAVFALLAPLFVLGALLPLVLSGGSVSFTVGSWDPSLGIRLVFDGLSWLLDLLAWSVSLAAYLYSRGAGPRGGGFSAIFFVLLAALAATAATADLFNLFVCLELVGLSSYALVASSRKGGAYLAAFRYLALSSASMSLFLLGVYGLYRLTGSLSYEAIGAVLSGGGGGTAGALSVACIVVAVGLRVTVVPLQGWLPDAHSRAPHAVSAVLSGVLIKTPLFALGRFLLFLPLGAEARSVLGAAGAITTLVGVVAALAQKDAKRLLAYHSVSQIGYVLAAWGAGAPGAVAAAYLHALFHGLFKGSLFLSVGTACDAGGSRDVYELRRAAGALRTAGDRVPVVSAAFFVAALSIAAIPPLNGYASKEAIAAVLHGDGAAAWAPWAYALLMVTGAGTVASMLKLSRIFLPGRKATAAAAPAIPEAEPSRDGRLALGGTQAAAAAQLEEDRLAADGGMTSPAGAALPPGLQPSVGLPPTLVPPSREPPPAAAKALPDGSFPGGFRVRTSMRIGIGILAALCLVSAVSAPALARFAARLLGEETPLHGDYLSLRELAKSATVIASGIALYFAATTKAGKAVARRLREGRAPFSRLVLALALALAGLGAALAFGL